jgi:hypothetical protein
MRVKGPGGCPISQCHDTYGPAQRAASRPDLTAEPEATLCHDQYADEVEDVEQAELSASATTAS